MLEYFFAFFASSTKPAFSYDFIDSSYFSCLYKEFAAL